MEELSAQLVQVEARLRENCEQDEIATLEVLRAELAEAIELFAEAAEAGLCPVNEPTGEEGGGTGVASRKRGAEGELHFDATKYQRTTEVGPRSVAADPSTGELFQTKVRTEGVDVPPALAQVGWDRVDNQAAISADTQRALNDVLGLPRPTAVQRYAVPILLERRDLLCSAPTGSGKTLAFVVPIVELVRRDVAAVSGDRPLSYHCAFPFAVVIAPTRELAAQISGVFHSLVDALQTNLQVVLLCGGKDEEQQAAVLRESGADVVVGTPGRLLDFLRREKVGLARCTMFFLDEADRMLEMGFESDLRAILASFGRPDAPQSLHGTPAEKRTRTTALFSATFPRSIRLLASDMMGARRVGLVVGGLNAGVGTVEHRVQYVDSADKITRLREALTHTSTVERGLKVIVFAATKKTVDYLTAQCVRWRVQAQGIHGSMGQSARENALAGFRAGGAPGKPSVLVATDVAARGLHVEDAAAVINFDFPKSLEEYVHRTGRTGRAGRRGTATSFFCWKYDRKLARPLREFLEAQGQVVPEFLQTLQDTNTSADTASDAVQGDREDTSSASRFERQPTAGPDLHCHD
jgi:ATP-dependent RNA helicase DDX3X